MIGDAKAKKLAAQQRECGVVRRGAVNGKPTDLGNSARRGGQDVARRREKLVLGEHRQRRAPHDAGRCHNWVWCHDIIPAGVHTEVRAATYGGV